MENLKSIKDRIGTVESIIKATNAMKMVSTVKLSRINTLEKMAKDCYDALLEMISLLLSNLIFDQKLDDDYWLLPQKNGKQLVIVLSTNQGFCGSFNQLIIEEAKNTINNCSNPLIKIFGKKASVLSPSSLVEVEDRLNIAKFGIDVFKMLEDCLKNDQISEILVVSGCFKNALVQKAKTVKVFPIVTERVPKYVQVDTNEFKLAEALFKACMEQFFVYTMKEHIVSELSARTMAMDNSVRNARDMSKTLNVIYNRSRQAKITQELTEIISSIECVQ